MHGPDADWPLNGLESVPLCPICGARERMIVYNDLWDRVFFCAPGIWTLYRCAACGSGYLDPRPTKDTIGLAYTSYFTHDRVENRDDFKKRSVLQRIRRAFANGYRNSRYGTNFRPANRLGAIAAHLLPTLRNIVDTAARHLPRPPVGATLLDIGCGNGKFLDFAAAMGWDAEGVDVDARAVEVARERGLKVHVGGSEVLSDRSCHYDVITLSHVVEHVHDPISLLHDCYRLLKPGGRIWLETPNFQSAGYRRYGRAWVSLDPPRHLVLFTQFSLKAAFSKLGFIAFTSFPPRPHARAIYADSEAIKAGKAPFTDTKTALSVRLRAWCAERNAKEVDREELTVSARKPGY